MHELFPCAGTVPLSPMVTRGKQPRETKSMKNSGPEKALLPTDRTIQDELEPEEQRSPIGTREEFYATFFRGMLDDGSAIDSVDSVASIAEPRPKVCALDARQ